MNPLPSPWNELALLLAGTLAGAWIITAASRWWAGRRWRACWAQLADQQGRSFGEVGAAEDAFQHCGCSACRACPVHEAELQQLRAQVFQANLRAANAEHLLRDSLAAGGRGAPLGGWK